MFCVSSFDADPLYVVTELQPDGNVSRFLDQNPKADRAKIVRTLPVLASAHFYHGARYST